MLPCVFVKRSPPKNPIQPARLNNPGVHIKTYKIQSDKETRKPFSQRPTTPLPIDVLATYMGEGSGWGRGLLK